VYSRIIGVGSYSPPKVLTNFDLEKIVDTTNDWIVERSGIHSRFILENKKLSDMTFVAASKAIENAGIDKEQIDLIIIATLTSEYITPSAACVLKGKLGIKNHCPALDINAACAGFIYGLGAADAYIKSGQAKCILLVASEALTKVTDWKDRSTCVLFGDGAGAVILAPDAKTGVKSVHLYSDSHVDLLYAHNPIYHEHDEYIKMRGNEVFKFAVKYLVDATKEALACNNIDISDVDWLVPHQANLRIISAVAERLNFPIERIILTIDHHGNTSAASIPLAFDEGVRKGMIKHGETILVHAIGAGLTWGCALIDY
jgi:3-oxoacyl-[acyl-carrier-protein] synthase III